jgi:hypothetical protein
MSGDKQNNVDFFITALLASISSRILAQSSCMLQVISALAFREVEWLVVAI